MYRYKLILDDLEVDITPTKEDLDIGESRVDGYYFSRMQWPQVQLTGRAFELVFNGSNKYQYYITYEELENGAYREEMRGKFTRAKCNINEKEKIISVTPETVDRYTTVLEQMEKEFDLLKLAPSTQNVKYYKYPILQLYVRGSKVITNILKGRSWLQECTPEIDHEILTETYHFGDENVIAFIAGTDKSLSPDVTGAYQDVYQGNNRNVYQSVGHSNKYELVSYGLRFVRDTVQTNELAYYIGSDVDLESGYIVLDVPGNSMDDTDFNSVWNVPGGGTIKFIGVNSDGYLAFKSGWLNGEPDPDPGASGTLTHNSGATHTGDLIYTEVVEPIIQYRWAIYDTLASSYVYIAPMQTKLNTDPVYQNGVTFTAIGGSDQVKLLTYVVYARFLTDLDQMQYTVSSPTTTFFLTPKDLPEVDIVPVTKNYTKAQPFNMLDSQYTVSDEHSPTIDGGLGVYSESAVHYSKEYFVKPSTPAGLIPVQLTEWSEQSFWFAHVEATTSMQADNRQDITLRHAYKLSSVIEVLLGQIDTTITHLDTEAYSDFLYAASNVIRGTKRDIFITPKSNIIEANYTNPARVAKIKLSDIRDAFRFIYNAFIDVDIDKKLVIEHLHYWFNGGDYSTTKVGPDITTAINPKTGLTIIPTKKWKYREEEIPQYLSWAWMDEVSEYFEGNDIECLDSFAKQGAKEEMRINIFTSDLDYILIQPESISKDGFVILEATQSGDDYIITEPTVEGEELQNGYLAVPYMQPTYFKHGLPTKAVNINGAITEATTVKRTKEENIEIPDIGYINHRLLITTLIGTGLIVDRKRKIVSRSNVITIEHDTEL